MIVPEDERAVKDLAPPCPREPATPVDRMEAELLEPGRIYLRTGKEKLM